MGASVTIPDQTMSMRTLIDRYRRGMPLEMRMKNPLFYNGEFPDLEKMDLSEIQQLKKQVNEDVKRMKQDLESQEEYKRLQKANELQQKIKALQEEVDKTKAQISTKNDS